MDRLRSWSIDKKLKLRRMVFTISVVNCNEYLCEITQGVKLHIYFKVYLSTIVTVYRDIVHQMVQFHYIRLKYLSYTLASTKYQRFKDIYRAPLLVLYLYSGTVNTWYYFLHQEYYYLSG